MLTDVWQIQRVSVTHLIFHELARPFMLISHYRCHFTDEGTESSGSQSEKAVGSRNSQATLLQGLCFLFCIKRICGKHCGLVFVLAEQ